MAKQKANAQKRRRSRVYTGDDARVTSNKVTRVSIPDRNSVSQFWHENRRKYLGRIIVVSILAVIFWILFALVTWLI